MAILFFIISSTLFPQNISCGNIPLTLKLQKDTIYTYNNSLSIATWPKGRESEPYVSRQKGSFQSKLLPLRYSASSGFLVNEVNVKSDNKYVLQFLGKMPEKLPVKIYYPSKTIGVLEDDPSKEPKLIRSVKCNSVFKTTEELALNELGVKIIKKHVHKVMGLTGKDDVGVIHILTKSKVELIGKMAGRGTETTDTFYILKTRELYEKKIAFRYEYDTGIGDNRYTEVMSGEYHKKLSGKAKSEIRTPVFPNVTSIKNNTRFYTNNGGLFVPVTLNTTLKTKMYIKTDAPSSYIYYPYYYQNFPDDPGNYFLPFRTVDIAKNTVANPGISIKPENYDEFISFKIPGVIGNDILSMGTVYLNEKKRSFAFFENDAKNKTAPPENSTIFKLVNNNIVFTTVINSTNINTTLSFSVFEPEISQRFREKLNIKTRKFTLTQKDPGKKVVEKANVIFTPSDSSFQKMEVLVRDFGDTPYDMKLGLNFIKNKEITINYKDKWLLIKKAK
ncbi:MAG: hypothetical protein JXA66_06480 [Oligoflexia bacterium]|nr:hypothetical protein [Oligoflexia bacterium]